MSKTISQPDHVHQALAEHFNRGDLQALLALYEAGATLVPQPGTAVSGTEAIRAALRAREWLSRSMIAVEAPGWRGATKANTAVFN